MLHDEDKPHDGDGERVEEAVKSGTNPLKILTPIIPFRSIIGRSWSSLIGRRR